MKPQGLATPWSLNTAYPECVRRSKDHASIQAAGRKPFFRYCEVCRRTFVEANRELERGENMDEIPGTVLDLVILFGELRKLGLATDGAMKVYLDNLRWGRNTVLVVYHALGHGSDHEDIDVEWYVQSYWITGLPSLLMDGIWVGSYSIVVLASILIKGMQRRCYLIWRTNSSSYDKTILIEHQSSTGRPQIP